MLLIAQVRRYNFLFCLFSVIQLFLKEHGITGFKARLLLASLCLVNSNAALANPVELHTKLWTSLIYTGPISTDGKWKYYLEPQLRLVDTPYKFENFNFYLANYYQIVPKVTLWLGVFNGLSKTHAGVSHQEYRLWEQIHWKIIEEPTFLNLISRTRLEERKRKGFAQVADRLREKLQLELPIGRSTKCYFTLADEIFFNLNRPSWVVDRLFAQNRASVGVRLPMGKNAAYEVGYLNQFEYGTPDRLNNVLYFNVFLNTPSSQNVQNE